MPVPDRQVDLRLAWQFDEIYSSRAMFFDKKLVICWFCTSFCPIRLPTEDDLLLCYANPVPALDKILEENATHRQYDHYDSDIALYM